MPTDIHCIVPSSVTGFQNNGAITTVSKSSIAECTHEELKKTLGQLEGDWVTFANTEAEVNSFSTALSSWERPDSDASILIGGHFSPQPVLHAWQSLPSEIAAILYPPEQVSGFLFSRKSLLQQLAQTDFPLWWFLIQSCTNLQIISSGGDAVVPQTDWLQSLNPSSKQDANVTTPTWLIKKVTQSYEDLIAKKYSTDTLPSSPDSYAILSGLLLWHGQLEKSHEISQVAQGKGVHFSCDYWHAIMHRLEPDDSNSNYWFRHVGSHPIFPRLQQLALQLFEEKLPDHAWRFRFEASSAWTPSMFIKLCSECRATNEEPLSSVARRIQQWEMLLLLEQTVLDAFPDTLE